MDEEVINSLRGIRNMMIIDGILVAGIGTYLSFYTQHKWVGIFLLIVILSSLATVFTTCATLLNKRPK